MWSYLYFLAPYPNSLSSYHDNYCILSWLQMDGDINNQHVYVVLYAWTSRGRLIITASIIDCRFMAHYQRLHDLSASTKGVSPALLFSISAILIRLPSCEKCSLHPRLKKYASGQDTYSKKKCWLLARLRKCGSSQEAYYNKNLNGKFNWFSGCWVGFFYIRKICLKTFSHQRDWRKYHNQLITKIYINIQIRSCDIYQFCSKCFGVKYRDLSHKKKNKSLKQFLLNVIELKNKLNHTWLKSDISTQVVCHYFHQSSMKYDILTQGRYIHTGGLSERPSFYHEVWHFD